MKYIICAEVKVTTLEKRLFEVNACSEVDAIARTVNHIETTYPQEPSYDKKAVRFSKIVEVNISNKQ